MRSYIGLASYYRKFVPNFSAIAVPLTDLTKKGKTNKVELTKSQERAFNSLRKSMTSFPILRLPDLSKPFIVMTDASDVGLGAVFLQEHDSVSFPIMYVSKKCLE